MLYVPRTMILDAVLTPAEIDLLPQQDLGETVCVVFDVLRATSSMITALAHGAEAIRPALTVEEALATRADWPDAILGGERFGNRIEGFDLGNSPSEYRRPGLRRIVTTTTNGTVALRACTGADRVLAAALLNMQAAADSLRSAPPARVLLVCAGTFRELALEDVFAAGMLAAQFPSAELTDAARTALAVYTESACDPLALLQRSKNGRRLIADGRGGDVTYCAGISRYAVVGVMREGVLTPEQAAASPCTDQNPTHHF